ncbi:hypothetical protein [Micromonospora globbae]|uniref:phage tail tube protein n=1 Tax=Micromonospora globbae TaxID=1894969 RepID=UPI00342BEF58
MADIPGDGKVRVDWLPAVANMASVTLAEIAAGIRASQWMTADGLVGFRPDTADVATSGIESTFDTAVNGRRSFSGTLLRFKKQSGSDIIYGTLLPDVTGFVVLRRSLAASVPHTSGQPIQVYHVMCGETAWMDPEPNTVERFEIPLKMQNPPVLRAVVA